MNVKFNIRNDINFLMLFYQIHVCEAYFMLLLNQSLLTVRYNKTQLSTIHDLYSLAINIIS